MQRLLISAILYLISVSHYSQESSNFCGFDNMLQQKITNGHSYNQQLQKYEREILVNSTQLISRNNAVYTIPVVIHIMHLPEDSIVGNNSNIPDSQIMAGLNHLNDAFRNTNSYAGGPYFSNAGIPSVDTQIEFCLASEDPTGNPTFGINRIPSEHSNLYALEFGVSGFTKPYEMKTLSNWNSNDYLNVWIVNNICEYSTPSGCGLVGLSTFPPTHGYLNDGVVIEAGVWGTNSTNSKVQVHEIGHYLGLYHTFQGGCSENDCQTGGDKICDTPPDNSIASGAGSTMNSCSNDSSIANSPFTSDVQDIYENYMDYSTGNLKNTFTPDQKSRMELTLNTTRSSLINSNGCNIAVLPVELILFSAKKINANILIEWKTSTEFNNDYFILERKRGNDSFKKIAKIEKPVNQQQENHYSFVDDIIYNTSIYYRLSQIDLNGNLQILAIKEVKVNDESTFKIVPNPINKYNDTNIIFNSSRDQEVEMNIFQLSGNKILKQRFQVKNGQNQIRIDFSPLNSGLYICVLTTEKNYYHQKIFVE